MARGCVATLLIASLAGGSAAAGASTVGSQASFGKTRGFAPTSSGSLPADVGACRDINPVLAATMLNAMHVARRMQAVARLGPELTTAQVLAEKLKLPPAGRVDASGHPMTGGEYASFRAARTAAVYNVPLSVAIQQCTAQAERAGRALHRGPAPECQALRSRCTGVTYTTFTTMENSAGKTRTTEAYANGVYAFSNTSAQDSSGNTVATTSYSLTTLANFSYYVVGSNGWVNTGKIAAATMEISTGGKTITVTMPAAKSVPQTNIWFLLPGNTQGGQGYIDATGENGFVWPIGGSAYSGDYAHISVSGKTMQTCVYVNNALQSCGKQNSLLTPSGGNARPAAAGGNALVGIGGIITGIGNILSGLSSGNWGTVIAGGGQIIAACGNIDCLDLLSGAGVQEFCSGEGYADADIMEYCASNVYDFIDDDPIGGFDGGFSDDTDGFGDEL
jgi:hypothetical protein